MCTFCVPQTACVPQVENRWFKRSSWSFRPEQRHYAEEEVGSIKPHNFTGQSWDHLERPVVDKPVQQLSLSQQQMLLNIL